MATDDVFRAQLDQMIDLRHPLAILASRMPWLDIEAALAPAFAQRDRTGRVVEGADMFGPTMTVASAGVSNAGRPRLPIRLMVALLYLKHAYNECDESLVERWAQDRGKTKSLAPKQRASVLWAALPAAGGLPTRKPQWNAPAQALAAALG